MRVFFLTHCYPSYPGHFACRFVESLAHGLGKFGYEVSVVTPRIFDRDPLFERHGSVKVYRHRFLTANKYLKYYKRLPVFRMLTYFAGAVWTGLRVIRRDHCVLIHAHWIIPSGLIALILAGLTGLPFVVHARGSDVTVYSKKSWLLYKVAEFVLRRAKYVVTRSRSLQQEIVNIFHVQEKKLRAIPTGVDLTLFRPGDKKEAKTQLGLPQDRNIILFVGNLIDIKGVHCLVESLPSIVVSHKDVLCVLVGEGEMRTELENRIMELGLKDHVSFSGGQPYERIPLWMNAAELLIVPSLSESGPNVVAEALACHLPVVATKVGDIPNLVSHMENGLLIDRVDPESISSALNLLLGSDRGLYDRIKRGCLTHSAPRSIDSEAEQNIAIYDRLLQ